MHMNLSKLQERVKDKGDWRAAVHGVAKTWTWLSDWLNNNTSKSWESKYLILMLNLHLGKELQTAGLQSFSLFKFRMWLTMWPYFLLNRIWDFAPILSKTQSLLIPGIDYFAAVVIQSLSCVWLFVTLWTAAHQAPLLFTISSSSFKFMFIESVMLPDHLILCHPFSLFSSIFGSIRVFSNESTLLTRWPKYLGFSISPSNEYSELISFMIDSFDLLAVQETLKSLLQHHNLKASILWWSAFFMVQLSHLYMTTGKLQLWLDAS